MEFAKNPHQDGMKSDILSTSTSLHIYIYIHVCMHAYIHTYIVRRGTR